MGATYDIVVVCSDEQHRVLCAVGGFLSQRYATKAPCDLVPDEIIDDKAVLVSQPRLGWIQLLGSASGMGYSITQWFHRNPLAEFLSLEFKKSLHIWSLNSGYVAGYTFFQEAALVESSTIFAASARSGQTDLMPGVSVPPSRPGRHLATALADATFDFSAYLLGTTGLEVGIAGIVGKFGFPVHLVDFYDATDETEGIAVQSGRYTAAPLVGWSAICFH